MIEIKDLLGRFSKIIDTKDLELGAIASILSEILNTKIEKGDIELKGSTLYLDLKPIYKNQILIKREQIEERLLSILNTKKVDFF